ncbi:hypothetical protein PHMEG_00033908 [Phytophthora megakarya]|uniref:DDE Tnp4 domain-containing protein n=1 Tax=Phytophthora megakarya TaxID=4795 RepID=A0A225USP7_9STRA|nr:hypothetical protein PHMEG_00033908 [Phytophthora megakarya]
MRSSTIRNFTSTSGFTVTCFSDWLNWYRMTLSSCLQVPSRFVVEQNFISKGSVHNYLFRASTAVTKFESSTVNWPDPAERKLTAGRMNDKYGFVNCVGVTDGTLFPLASKPSSHGEDYYSRKASYSVNALITCDDVARVRDIVVGWPGSVHDNRVWTNSRLAMRPKTTSNTTN